MVYLFVGIDEISKERSITKIRGDNFGAQEYSFDYESLYADELDKIKLIDSLNRLPLQAKKRIVVIRQIDRLSSANREILLSFIKKPHNYIELILDAGISNLEDSQFLPEFSRLVKTLYFKKETLPSVFDLADAIIRKNAPGALKIFARLIISGEKPHRLLGGLSWKWNKARRLLKEDAFCKGLELFRRTDTDIKLGRLKPNLALELLVIKLCDLPRA